MRYTNLIPASHISRSADPRLTADARRAFITTKAAVVASTETAKRFAATVAPPWSTVTARSTARRSCALRPALRRPAWK
ncbi:hypothetical protein FV232_23700 [Methylobacterium sp. WL30]|uniref:hypothetical protein n=1 Tax=unclassified Methylobacterium TaxID=2615210 RepID=UPI0011CA86BA|nr:MULTISPECIES: hypothetical protein [unclassified Methylobacterium]TXN34144.1 hypothetical protein FV225_17660 [Methylobacterium sp. WL93]TXN45089.1 hypothetical protein FV227_25640 [Methylobacterium sp. WL119]TXN63260.1 hypothetical protein FV232_23700 [Methylobacterium sp. WL30]